MKINWRQKLTSRKFWAAVVGFVTPTLLAFGIAENIATQVAGIIMAGATCIAYIIGEGLVDANRTDTKGETDEVEADISAFADDYDDVFDAPSVTLYTAREEDNTEPCAECRINYDPDVSEATAEFPKETV